MFDQENEKWKSVAALRSFICGHSEKKYQTIEYISKFNDCINHPLPRIPCFQGEAAAYAGNTLLHIALLLREISTFNLLISQGADYTMKNLEGETVLHQAFHRSKNRSKECDQLWGKLSNAYIEMGLSAHVKNQNACNPSNKNGLTHFHLACMVNHTDSMDLFMENGVSVHDVVSFESSSLPGYSPLHIAVRYSNHAAVLALLSQDADMNLKDAQGMSPLHLLVVRNTEIADWLNTGRRTRFEAFEKELCHNERIMSAFIMLRPTDDHLSVIDDYGFTPLHIDCTYRQQSASAEELLELGHSVEPRIKDDSPIFPGYTPLHFAAHFNMATVKLLLKAGADISCKDAKGVMPFDICLRKLDIANDLHVLIASQESWRSIMFSDGKTSLYDFAFAMHKRDQLHSFLLRCDDLDMHLDPNAPLWAGYTPLHLLVLFVVSSNGAWDLYESSDYVDDVSWHDLRMIDAIELALKQGADVTLPDCRGCSPLHLAFHLQKSYLVSVLLRSHQRIFYPIDENGLSHFHIACVAKDTDFVVKLLNSRLVNVNHPVTFDFRVCKDKKTFVFVKGSTPLHIAVITKNYDLTRILLTHGANYVCKDDVGLTPVHRLFGLSRSDDRKLARALLSSYNLCFMDDNVAPVTECGLTYLHVVSYWNNEAAVEKLLDLGAHINATITYTSVSNNQDSGRKRILSIKTDSPIDSLTALEKYNGLTPLQVAMMEKNDAIVKILLQRGADILVKNSDGMSPLYDVLKSTYCTIENTNVFFDLIRCDVALQNRILADSGMTMLHIACAISDMHLIKHLCNQGVDVNARIHMDSPIWPGCTPLHVLIIKSKDNLEVIGGMINDLLEYGADVTLTNADQKTPIHEDFERYFVRGPRFAIHLLKAQKDYSINPVSNKGISHFHIACSCKYVKVVEEFLQHGADINLPINYFCEFYGGLTPLHLASLHHPKDAFSLLGKRRIDCDYAIHYLPEITDPPFYVAPYDDYRKTLELLLQRGANPNTEDRTGNTSLHLAAASNVPQLRIIKRLYKAGADLNRNNLLEETPLEILLLSPKLNCQSIEFFLEHGGKINIYNSQDQGLIPRAFTQIHNDFKENYKLSLLDAIVNLPDIDYSDESGRSLIHNVVSHAAKPFSLAEYMTFIQNLKLMGCDINQRDNTGQTALQVAIGLKSVKAVSGLLACGADINVLDQDDSDALMIDQELQKSVTASMDNASLLKCLSIHIQTLKSLEIYVNEVNQQLDAQIRENIALTFHSFEKARLKEIETSKATKIEPYSLTLHDFLSETAVVGAYPLMPQVQRRAIDDYFRDNCKILRRSFIHLFGVMQLQFRKAVDRVPMIEPAKTAFSILIQLALPDLCSEAILRFLPNEDLKNLIVAGDAIL